MLKTFATSALATLHEHDRHLSHKMNIPVADTSRPEIRMSNVQHVVINVGDHTFSKIFHEGHVNFIDRLKNTGKRSANYNDSDGDVCSKKQKN